MAPKKSTDLATRVNGSAALATPLEPWEQELAERAKQEKAAEVVGVPRITHRGGVLKIDDKPIMGNKLKCVIIGYSLAKTFFKEAFDPNAPAASPICYAFAKALPGEEAKMAPHDQAPVKQNEGAGCATCPHNVFGTADTGRGKRCQDKRRVYVIMGNEDKGSIVKAQVRQIEVPPGSLRNWGNFQKQVEEITPIGVRGVLTEISTAPGEKGAYTLTFTPVDKLDREFVKAVVAKEKTVESDMFAPFPVIAEEEDRPKAKARSQASRKKVE